MSKGKFLIEAKATESKTMRLDRHWLRKIHKEAVDVNKYPALLIQFIDSESDVLRTGSWVMVEEQVFKELVEISNE